LLSGCLAAAGLLPRAAEALDVKTGLWELTVSASAAIAAVLPQIPSGALARLSPDQQQRLTAAIGALRQPLTHKICVTRTTLRVGPKFREPAHCTRTLTASTAQVMEFHLECTGAHAGTGTLRVVATDRETITLDADINIAHDGASLPVRHGAQGRWLGPDCGSVKPND
jgi:hypothetical protein